MLGGDFLRRQCCVVIVNRTDENWQLVRDKHRKDSAKTLAHGRWASPPVADSLLLARGRADHPGGKKKKSLSAVALGSSVGDKNDEFFRNWHPGVDESVDAVALIDARRASDLPPETLSPQNFVVFATQAKTVLSGAEADLKFEAGGARGFVPLSSQRDPPLVRLRWATPKIGTPRASADVECGNYLCNYKIFLPEAGSKGGGKGKDGRPGKTGGTGSQIPRILFTIYDPASRQSELSDADDAIDDGPTRGAPAYSSDDDDMDREALTKSAALSASSCVALEEHLSEMDRQILEALTDEDFLSEAVALRSLLLDMLSDASSRHELRDSTEVIQCVLKLSQFSQFLGSRLTTQPSGDFRAMVEAFLVDVNEKVVHVLVRRKWSRDSLELNVAGSKKGNGKTTSEYDAVQMFLRRSLQLVAAALAPDGEGAQCYGTAKLVRGCGDILRKIFDDRASCYDDIMHDTGWSKKGRKTPALLMPGGGRYASNLPKSERKGYFVLAPDALLFNMNAFGAAEGFNVIIGLLKDLSQRFQAQKFDKSDYSLVASIGDIEVLLRAISDNKSFLRRDKDKGEKGSDGKGFAVEWALTLKETVFDVLSSMPEDLFRERGNSAEIIGQLTNDVEAILRRAVGADKAGEALHQYRLALLARGLHSSLLNRRVDAISDLNNILRASMHVSTPQWNTGGYTYRQQQQQQRAGKRRDGIQMTPEAIHKWLSDEKIVSDALLHPSRLHTEIVQRCDDLFSFLAETNGLKLRHLDVLWEATRSTGDAALRGCVYELLVKIASELSLDGNNYVLRKLREDVPLSEVTMDELELANALAKSMLDCELESTRSKKTQKKHRLQRLAGLDFMWDVIDVDQYLGEKLLADPLTSVADGVLQSAARKLARLVHSVDDDSSVLNDAISRATRHIRVHPSEILPQWQTSDLCVHLLNNLLSQYQGQSKLRSQAQVIEELDAEHDLLNNLVIDWNQLVRRTLASLDQNFLPARQAQWDVELQLGRRLRLLRFVLANSKLSLPDEIADLLWDSYICRCGLAYYNTSKPEPGSDSKTALNLSDSVFTWFHEICADELVVDPSLVAKIFGKFSRQEALPKPLLSRASFQCFTTFFEFVNSQSGVFRPSNGSVTIPGDLQGLDGAWVFALDSPYSSVVELAVDFHLRCYGGMGAHPDARDELRTSDLKELFRKIADRSSAAQISAGRVLQVVRMLLEADDDAAAEIGSDPKKGVAGDVDEEISSSVTLQVSSRMQSQTTNIDAFFVRCSLQDTVASVRARVALRVHDSLLAEAQRQGTKPPKFNPGSLLLFVSDRELADNDASLASLHVQDRQIVQYDVSAAKDPSGSRWNRIRGGGDSSVPPKALLPPSTRALVVKLQNSYDVIFSVIENKELNRSVDGLEVVQLAWSVLLLLPVNRGTLNQVSALALEPLAHNSADWKSKLFSPSRHPLLLQYYLQATESLAELQADWSEGFRKTDGHLAAVELLNSMIPAQDFDSSSSVVTVGLLVRIILAISDGLSTCVPGLVLTVFQIISKSVLLNTDDLEMMGSTRALLSATMHLLVRLVGRFPDDVLPLMYNMKEPTLDEFLLGGSLKCISEGCREEFLSGIVELCLLKRERANDNLDIQHPREVIRPLLRKMVAHVGNFAENCAEFFKCVTSLIEADADAEESFRVEDEGALPPLLDHVVDAIKQRPVVEWHDRGSPDKVLVGCMELVHVYIGHFPKYRARLVSNDYELVRTVFESLFDLGDDSVRDIPPPKCKTAASRDMAFRLLETLTSDCAPAVAELCDSVVKHHCDNEAVQKVLSGRDNWNVEVSREERSAAGYVGLRNLGSTCYLNSVLQQLFMIPKFRKGILAYEPALLEEFSDSNVGLKDGAGAEHDKTRRNLDKTDDSGNENDDSDGGVVPQDGAKPKSDVPSARDDNEHVLLQVQRLFAWLQESHREAYDTTPLCKVYKDWEGRPVDTRMQQDADEFLAQLCDKIEEAVKGSRQENLLRNCWGVTQASEIVCDGCPHRSENVQSSFTVSLDVRGNDSVYSALDDFVKGDVLEGSNAYHCEQCGVSRDAVKRTLIKDLPDTLIVHLKRFEFDLETMRKKKVNDYCSFPIDEDLDLWPYTQAYSRLREASDGKAGDTTSAVPSTLTQEDCQYRLCGVVVHNGGAEGGHYYSFIREPLRKTDSTPARWLEFNDRIVRVLRQDTLPRECFGGDEVIVRRSAWTRQQWTETISRTRSAYMLIYERTARRDEEIVEDPAAKSDSTRGAFGAALFAKNLLGRVRNRRQVGPLTVPVPIWLGRVVADDNSRFLRQKHMFDPAYANFVADVVSSGVASARSAEESGSRDTRLLGQALRVGVLFLFRVAGRTTDRRFVDTFSAQLQEVLRASKEACRWFCCYFAGIPFDGMPNTDTAALSLLTEVLLECPILQVRSNASQICVLAIKVLLELDEETAQLPADEEPPPFAGRSEIDRVQSPLLLDSDNVKARCPSLALADALLESVVAGAPWAFYSEAFEFFFKVARTGIIERKFMVERGWLGSLLRMLASTRRRHCTRTSMQTFVKTLWILITNARLPRDWHDTGGDGVELALASIASDNFPPTQRAKSWLVLPNGGEAEVDLLLTDAVLDRLILRALDSEKVGQILQHVTWERQASSTTLTRYLVEVLRVSDLHDQRWVFVAVHDILDMRDSMQEARTAQFLTAFFRMLKELRSDRAEVSRIRGLIEAFLKRRDALDGVKKWSKKNRSEWEWVIKWSEENPQYNRYYR